MKNKGRAFHFVALAMAIAIIVCAIPMSAVEYSVGDMNGDGTVNSDDAIYLLRHTLDPEKYPLATGGVDGMVEELLESKHKLRFGEDGQFKILVFADLHLKASTYPDYIENSIKTLVDRESPDLIILTGDNVADKNINDDATFKATLAAAMDYVEEKQIPWMHVYGNHDSEGSYSREKQQAVYESFDHCISKSGDDLTGVGNYVIPVYSSTDDEVKFTVWGLDSGSYMSGTDKAKYNPVTSTFGGYDTVKYDYIHGDQIEWYMNASKLLAEYNGGSPIPGIMAFHIPLQETYTAWENRTGLEWTGEKRDPICSSSFNSGLFGAIVARGDIKAIVNGHDHINDFMVNYGGVKLCYSPNFSPNTYNNEDMHGGRVFVINENNPEKVDTYVSYVIERVDYSDAEEIGNGYVYNFEGTAPEFRLSSWPYDTSAEAYVNEIEAKVVSGVGVNGSKALASRRTEYHSASKGLNTEVRWDLDEAGLLGNNKYLMVWIDLEANNLDFRKASFGLIRENVNTSPYTTDNYDTPCAFYYKAEGSNSWQVMYTGKDGCIGEKDSCSVKGYKGWFAFPIEYMLNDGDEKLNSDSVITGIYIYYSVPDAESTGKYVYFDEITLVEEIDFSVISNFDGIAPDFTVTGWNSNTAAEVYVSEIKTDIIEGAGVNGSKALGTKRTTYHSDFAGRAVELRWNTIAPVTIGDSEYFKIWLDLGTGGIDFRKAIFGLLVDGEKKPYTTDNTDEPTEFYYLADGSDKWTTMYTGSDGCIGVKDNCSVYGIKGWLAFPLEYMLGPNGESLESDTNVTGIYFYYSYDSEEYFNKYIYVDEVSLVEDYK